MDPPRLTSIYVEANHLAPNRRKTSDGTLGDAAHRLEISDHNPDSRGIVHAIDLSQSKPGAPYWKPGYDVFDVFALFHGIIDRYRAATPVGRADRFVWLKYLVWYEAAMGCEVIFDPSAHGLAIVPNGYPHIGHVEHGHISINEGLASENDTRPIFGSVVVTPPKPLPPPPPPATTRITFEGEPAMQIDISMNLDDHGNGYVDLDGNQGRPRRKAVDAHVAWPIAVPDPQVVHGYGPIPGVSLTISPAPAAVARIVVAGGVPRGRQTVRVITT